MYFPGRVTVKSRTTVANSRGPIWETCLERKGTSVDHLLLLISVERDFMPSLDHSNSTDILIR